MKLTVTEALAELTTIVKRIQKKEQFVQTYLYRPEKLKDPHAKDGGSPELIKREQQAINDLRQRFINIRLAVQKANLETPVTVEGVTKSLAEWLVWRKELASGEQATIGTLLRNLATARVQAHKAGAGVVAAGDAANDADLVVNVNEADLNKRAEELETILGALDGQLSLKNATVQIEVQ